MKISFTKLVTTKPYVEVKADTYKSAFYPVDSAKTNGINLSTDIYSDLDTIQIGGSKAKPTFTETQRQNFITPKDVFYASKLGSSYYYLFKTDTHTPLIIETFYADTTFKITYNGINYTGTWEDSSGSRAHTASGRVYIDNDNSKKLLFSTVYGAQNFTGTPGSISIEVSGYYDLTNSNAEWFDISKLTSFSVGE